MESELQTADSLAAGFGKGLNEGLKFLTNMHLVLRDENGNIKDERRVHNTVTTAGKNAIADQVLASPTLVKMGWMAIGTGSPAATLLGAEVARVAFTSKTRSGAVVTVVGDYAAGTGTGAITEAGTFDVVTANTVNMWMSASFSVINKGASDTLSISWTLTIA
ncbi:UNVERIFIED_ORG: hypothetical protein ABID57_000692 [Arthrobacter sp. UYEF1]